MAKTYGRGSLRPKRNPPLKPTATPASPHEKGGPRRYLALPVRNLGAYSIVALAVGSFPIPGQQHGRVDVQRGSNSPEHGDRRIFLPALDAAYIPGVDVSRMRQRFLRQLTGFTQALDVVAYDFLPAHPGISPAGAETVEEL